MFLTCGQNIHITITSAVGELHAGEDFNRCLARIDQGLLEGKRAGKNQVVRVC
jgi:PleD family two-component response regulator